MRFKSKDLMVSISPNVEIDEQRIAELCLGGTAICIKPTLDPCFNRTFWGCGGCSILISRGCIFNSCGGPGGSACDPTYIPCPGSFWQIEDPGDLVKVKEELRGLLKEVERLEEKGLPTQFQTRGEAEAAEQALEGALDHVRRQKKNLK